MTVPAINISELDGALGQTSTSGKRPLALVGVAPSTSVLAVNTPAAYGTVKGLKTALANLGPLLEAAAYEIERYGNPVVVVRSAASVAGSFGTLDVSAFSGTSVPTIGVSPLPPDDYECYIKFIAGGTIGTAGITYQTSRDDGRSLSPVTALGTATEIIIPDSGGINVDFAAGTVGAGSILRFRANAPSYSASDLGAALDALKNATLDYELVLCTGPIDATIFDTLSLKAAAFHTAGKHKAFLSHFRMPNAAESEATYKTAFDTAFGSKNDTSVSVAAGADEQVSAITGSKYRRSPDWYAAVVGANVSEEIDLADVDTIGPAKGIDIRDDNGNPKHHDETVDPGLDDSRALVLRTVEGRGTGVYINNPRLLAPPGSDFQYLQYRRVMNIARTELRNYFISRLSKPVRVNKKTGFIRETEARAIEKAIERRLAKLLLTKPKASDVTFTLSRTDNILSTFTLTGTCRITPLGYSKFFDVEVGFYNPALQVA